MLGFVVYVILWGAASTTTKQSLAVSLGTAGRHLQFYKQL
jgi:hypothetical protein